MPKVTTITELSEKARVGCWAIPPLMPDRCYFCPPAVVKPAVAFVVDEGGWGHGCCAGHKAQAEVWAVAR